MLRVLKEVLCVKTEKIFAVIVKFSGKLGNCDNVLCEGILKRIFSKQICFSYEIVGFQKKAGELLIQFRFVCWNREGQIQRYKTFKNMDQSKLMENVDRHSNKTVENFVGEFYKRLKRGNYTVFVNNRSAIIEEVKNEVI
ncbi:MAG: hypothetical protein M0R48_08515 [Candidatus Omnitrophica bacterium]|nr:hypothetical protein [Candidatus Omnitrophota bacterium]